MKNSKFLLFFSAVVMGLGISLLSNPEKSYAGFDLGPLGCCLSACFCDGFRCATPEGICNDTNFVAGQVCQESPGPLCETVDEPFGCCLIDDGECEDNATITSCDGLTWFEGASCSEISGCPATPSNAQVPAFTSWGLIALAAILGVVGFIVVIRNRKAAA